MLKYCSNFFKFKMKCFHSQLKSTTRKLVDATCDKQQRVSDFVVFTSAQKNLLIFFIILMMVIL